MIDKQTKRRKFVNEEFAKRTRGTNMPNRKKVLLLKKLWKIAKRKYK